MKRHLLLLLMILTGLAQGPAQAILTIEVVGGTEGAQPIAVVPFLNDTGIAQIEDVAGVIAADLARTGRFKPMPESDMLATPHTAEEVDLRDWRLLSMDNLVVGQVVRQRDRNYEVRFTLFDVFRGEKLAHMSFRSTPAELRFTAHRIADVLYERLTGQPGVFTTRIAYVTNEWHTGGNLGIGGQQAVLRVADADGHNPQTIVTSKDPIMSPAWSPDGRRLAYVSFENRKISIYVQELISGRRQRVAAYKGINGSPAWSPDGNRLAMTLSRDGDPEIYVLDMTSRSLTRLTNSLGIDTEPAWSPDGSQIIFTSGRGGGPQIYRVPATGGAATRVTFERDYNARASFSPDGRSLTLVTRVNGRFRIGLLDLSTGTTRMLSDGRLDESPSFAPNGSMVIYATQHQGRGVLAAVSLDGRVGQRLSQDRGDVREPAWSPISR